MAVDKTAAKAKSDEKFANAFDLNQTIPSLKLECTRRGLILKGMRLGSFILSLDSVEE
jgi:hypothetical protein